MAAAALVMLSGADRASQSSLILGIGECQRRRLSHLTKGLQAVDGGIEAVPPAWGGREAEGLTKEPSRGPQRYQIPWWGRWKAMWRATRPPSHLVGAAVRDESEVLLG